MLGKMIYLKEINKSLAYGEKDVILGYKKDKLN